MNLEYPSVKQAFELGKVPRSLCGWGMEIQMNSVHETMNPMNETKSESISVDLGIKNSGKRGTD